MRIIAGKHRGRNLSTISGNFLRPTSDRVRESIFNILTQGGKSLKNKDWVTNAFVLDGFAGTGAFGLEALSRGANHLTLMDNNQNALDTCHKNVVALNERSNTEILNTDCLNPPRTNKPCTLVFLDPPYFSGFSNSVIDSLEKTGWIADTAMIVFELEEKESFRCWDQAIVVEDRCYGNSRVIFACWTSSKDK
ncbi:MAG: 16S rRNA (guanine(966)-N(2))-methyltransferase RsmD [Pseudomonadota bacterium]|nr:16S rRNA (guanine(966)-N(2))-methyltransferase RsmD [Pseudomonadota bacterium]